MRTAQGGAAGAKIQHPLTSALGYEPPWMGIIEAQPGPHDLHALIGNGSCLAHCGF